MQNKSFSQERAAGILLPVSSLPSPYGIGSLGDTAYQWVDFLKNAGQRYWQVLPLGPTGFGDSPYQSFSAFAGNPYLIDLDLLCDNGLLTRDECSAVSWGESSKSVDYFTLFLHREPLLRKAFSRFRNWSVLEKFRAEQSEWLEDYALYMAVKAKMGLRSWIEWEDDIRLRKPEALAFSRQQYQEDIDYHVFVQYLFFNQWYALKEYAAEQGVGIIGDIPIYVSMDSADVWANSRLFLLNEEKKPDYVAGVPPDGFSDKGQLWGNPLYCWQTLKDEKYDWWIRRLHASLTMYDVLRIDHFRGFESYYAIPAENKDAIGGEWRKGPGMDFINAANQALGTANIIAEDLGFLTDGVRKLLRDSGYPGMKVLQFAFDSREASGFDYMPHNYDRHCVVYTGTHDNDTMRGWFSSAPPADVALACEYLGIGDRRQGVDAFVRAALSSVANLAILPIQDYLDLDGDARVNIPSTVGGRNWRWRLRSEQITSESARKIARMTKIFGRAATTDTIIRLVGQ